MNEEIIRPEFPRPDFQRDNWMNLNGPWKFSFDDENIGEHQQWYNDGSRFEKTIVVPFCFQSKLSGIDDQDLHENMWYRRSFDLPRSMVSGRKLLHFGAVDTVAKVWLNGVFLGTHIGGYSTFCFDVTDAVKEYDNVLVVKAEDSYECSKPRGKQSWGRNPDRCWYTASSGIWQTVWLECVGEVYLKQFKLTPDIDRSLVEVELYLNKACADLFVQMDVTYRECPVKQMRVSADSRFVKLVLSIREEDPVDELHYWTPETPNLYDLRLTICTPNGITDVVGTYFGMRKISVQGDQILLNNKPYYQKLVLDQGYWPESLITPPSDEAIKQDVLLAKAFGFNGARKHQKIEDPRYYYWADRLGLLVWGELPSGYLFNDEEIVSAVEEWNRFIIRDYNHPCLIAWVPLNESWGVRNIYTSSRQQAFALSLYHLTKALDPTRLVSTNDGWEQVHSDICGIHDYAGTAEWFEQQYADMDSLLTSAAQGRMLYAEGFQYTGGPILVTEYGGIAFESQSEEKWGYNEAVKNAGEFADRYNSLTESLRASKRICGYCYTQLTDVQQEVNGLADENRNVKVDPKYLV